MANYETFLTDGEEEQTTSPMPSEGEPSNPEEEVPVGFSPFLMDGDDEEDDDTKSDIEALQEPEEEKDDESE